MTTLINDHPHYTTIFCVTDSVFCLYGPWPTNIPKTRPTTGSDGIFSLADDHLLTIPGVDLGGIPLSRAPQIFRRNTRFAGTLIRPDYQFLLWFGDMILGLAPLYWPTCLNGKIKLELLWWRCSKSIPRHQMKYASVYATMRNMGNDCGIVYSARGFSRFLTHIVWSLKGVILPSRLSLSGLSPSRFHGADIQWADIPRSRQPLSRHVVETCYFSENYMYFY